MGGLILPEHRERLKGNRAFIGITGRRMSSSNSELLPNLDPEHGIQINLDTNLTCDRIVRSLLYSVWGREDDRVICHFSCATAGPHYS